ncbi:hypothetical protein I2900191A2_11040 [Intestinibacter bartlettii]
MISIISVYVFLALGVASAITFKEIYIFKVFRIKISLYRVLVIIMIEYDYSRVFYLYILKTCIYLKKEEDADVK